MTTPREHILKKYDTWKDDWCKRSESSRIEKDSYYDEWNHVWESKKKAVDKALQKIQDIEDENQYEQKINQETIRENYEQEAFLEYLHKANLETERELNLEVSA